MKLFVANKMVRNNTMNKDHVDGTELPQLLSQNTNTRMFGEAPHRVTVRLCANCKLN